MNVLAIMTPLMLIIGLGFMLNRKRFPSETFWDNVEKLTYYVLFPALIFSSLARSELSGQFVQQVILLIALPTLVLGFLQAAVMWRGFIAPASFTAMFQGAIRNNTFLGLAIIAMLPLENGVALMALVMTIMVIVVNFCSVLVLERWGDRPDNVATSQHRYQKVAVNLAKNPLIIASVAGMIFKFLPFEIPAPLLDAAAYLGKTSLPLALLTIGAGLRLSALGSSIFAILISSSIRLILLPLVVYTLCIWLQIEPTTTVVFVLYAALPTAMSAYVLASQMGGDKQTMARIITFQILASAVTLPVVLRALQNWL